jgi:hypothetical protein
MLPNKPYEFELVNSIHVQHPNGKRHFAAAINQKIPTKDEASVCSKCRVELKQKFSLSYFRENFRLSQQNKTKSGKFSYKFPEKVAQCFKLSSFATSN